jgi:hypothetical protein
VTVRTPARFEWSTPPSTQTRLLMIAGRGGLRHPRDPVALVLVRLSAPGVRVPRESVDHVGPTVPIGVAVAQQLGRDRVSVGSVEDQGAAQVVSCCE